MSQKTVQDYLAEVSAIAQGQDTSQAETAPNLVRQALAVFVQQLSAWAKNLGQSVGWTNYNQPSGTAYQIQQDSACLLKLFAQLRIIGTKFTKPVPPRQLTERIENAYLQQQVDSLKSKRAQCQGAAERQRKKATRDNLDLFYQAYDAVPGPAQAALGELQRRVQNAISRMELSKDWDPNKVDTDVELLWLAADLVVKGFSHMSVIEPLRKEF